MIDFEHVQQTVETLKTRLDRREIDEKTFEERLLSLIDVAEDGYYWMYGHESGRWYRHDGKAWLPDDPQHIKKSDTPQPTAAHSGPASDEPVQWGWFLISLVVLAVIGGIVYSSSLFQV